MSTEKWPQTAKEGEPSGPRFVVHGASVETIGEWRNERMSGYTVHHTRFGAESQLAAIRAAAGESL